VTVVGGGFAGLYAARNLGIDPEVRLTLVDRRNFHLFQPLLYQVATGALSPGDIAQPLRSVLRKQRNTTVILGQAVGLDPERREVLIADGGPIAYDTLIVATGAHHSYFDHPEWAPLAPGLKTIEDATEIRRRILIAFEAAEREADPARRQEWMTFLVVGGGPTGVELAGALGEISRTPCGATSARSGRMRPGSSWSKRSTGSCRHIRRIDPAPRSDSSNASVSRSGRAHASSTSTIGRRA
jgi:NADH dehydrogenase